MHARETRLCSTGGDNDWEKRISAHLLKSREEEITFLLETIHHLGCLLFPVAIPGKTRVEKVVVGGIPSSSPAESISSRPLITPVMMSDEQGRENRRVVFS